MKPKKIKIAIVDDHQIVIDGIVALLREHELIEVTANDTSAVSMIKRLHNLPIDVLITDIMMPEMNGQQFAKAVKNTFPQIRILALSMSGQGDIVDEMINNADISGYVLKNISKKELIEAILKIANGGIYFSDEVLLELSSTKDSQKELEKAGLTIREIEIVKLMEKEFSNKQISEALFISERTVETHRKNIFRKTNTSSVLGLIKFAYQHKII
jgi:two-component system nitrate/nitrite response regulator NarL